MKHAYLSIDAARRMYGAPKNPPRSGSDEPSSGANTLYRSGNTQLD